MLPRKSITKENVFDQGNSNFFKKILAINCLFLTCNGTAANQVVSNGNQCKEIDALKINSTETSDQCIIWSDSIIPEICSAGLQTRFRILKRTFLFHELEPLSLFDIFSVGIKNADSWKLQDGEEGADCISGTINRCTSCFKKISKTLRNLGDAYRSFDVTLSRFDCLPAVDTASATRPFSPNATCHNCKVWYRRWLLVHTLKIWDRMPCINWCFYTQLACPHLAPAKLWDYAGHPSFQCRDMDIDSWRHECNCIHPCDVKGIVAADLNKIGNAPSVQHDFFAAQVHCETRKKECRKKTKQYAKIRRNVDTLWEEATQPKHVLSSAHRGEVKTLLFNTILISYSAHFLFAKLFT